MLGSTDDCEEDTTREAGLRDGGVFLYVRWLGVASEEVAFWRSPAGVLRGEGCGQRLPHPGAPERACCGRSTSQYREVVGLGLDPREQGQVRWRVASGLEEGGRRQGLP